MGWRSYKGWENIFLQYYITLNCNLNCIACSSFSPLVEGTTHKDLDYIKKDFEKMYRITENGKKIYQLVLMGGEPLMHPNINEIIQYFSDLGVRLRIVTNGILIPKMNIQFFELLKTYEVEVKVSVYKSIKYEKIFNKLYEYDIPFGTYNQEGCFGHKYLHNEKKGVTDCQYRGNVYILKDNKVYTCSETAFFDTFDAKFKGQHNLKITEDDYVDLDDVTTLDELKEKRKKVPQLCEYCDGSEKTRTLWDTSKGELEEWLMINPI